MVSCSHFTVEGTEAHRGGRTHSGLCYSEQPGQDLNAGLSVSRATVLTVGFFFFFCYPFAVLGSNSGSHAQEATVLPLSHTLASRSVHHESPRPLERLLSN